MRDEMCVGLCVCVCAPSEVELITTPPQGSLYNLTFLHPTPHCLTLQSEEEECFLESTNSLWSSNIASLQNDKTPLQQSPFIMIVLNKRCFFWKMVSLHKHLTDIKISNSRTCDEDCHLPRMCKNKPQNENETINIQKHYPCLSVFVNMFTCNHGSHQRYFGPVKRSWTDEGTQQSVMHSHKLKALCDWLWGPRCSFHVWGWPLLFCAEAESHE